MPHSAILPDPRNGRRRPPLLLCCLLLLSGLLAASCVESSLPDGAVASVNGKTISLRLVQALMDSRSVDMGALEVSTPESMKNQYGEALGTLIIACLAEEELAERGQSVSEETVSREEKLIREDYEDEDLNAYLEREALDYEDWRRLLRVHLTMQAFERQVLLPGIRISVDEVRAYHAANVERFHVPEHMMLCFLAGEDKAQLEAYCRRFPTGATMCRTGCACSVWIWKSPSCRSRNARKWRPSTKASAARSARWTAASGPLAWWCATRAGCSPRLPCIPSSRARCGSRSCGSLSASGWNGGWRRRTSGWLPLCARYWKIWPGGLVSGRRARPLRRRTVRRCPRKRRRRTLPSGTSDAPAADEKAAEKEAGTSGSSS